MSDKTDRDESEEQAEEQTKESRAERVRQHDEEQAARHQHPASDPSRPPRSHQHSGHELHEGDPSYIPHTAENLDRCIDELLKSRQSYETFTYQEVQELAALAQAAVSEGVGTSTASYAGSDIVGAATTATVDNQDPITGVDAPADKEHFAGSQEYSRKGTDVRYIAEISASGNVTVTPVGGTEREKISAAEWKRDFAPFSVPAGDQFAVREGDVG